MKVHIALVLLTVTFCAVNALTCYDCQSTATDQCEPGDLTEVQCKQNENVCLSRQELDEDDDFNDRVKKCSPKDYASFTCDSMNDGDINCYFCDTDLCNQNDTQTA